MSLPPKTEKNLQASKEAMKKHLATVSETLGREIEFVVEQDHAAIHAMAAQRHLADDWPEIIYKESLAEIVRGVVHCATYKKNPRLKSAILATFTGNKIIFRIPSLNNPDGKSGFKYTFENGNLVCNRGSEFNYNLDHFAWPKYFEDAVDMSLDVSGASSEGDVEKMWIEAVNDVAKRKNFNQALQEPLEKLLKKGAKVDLPKFGDNGQLTAASFLLNQWNGESNLECMDFFVNNGANVYALIETATYHSRACLFRLLKRPEVDVNHQDANGKTFLHYAAEEYEDPKIIKEIKKDGTKEEIWVNPAKQFIAWKTDRMDEYYDTFFMGIKQFSKLDVTLKDKNGRTALDLARKMNNIWILPGLEAFCNSKSPKPAPSQPSAGAVKKTPVGKPQSVSPAAAKFNNGQAASGPVKLPKELLSLLDVMYQTIKQSASDTTALEQEYEKFTKIFKQ